MKLTHHMLVSRSVVRPGNLLHRLLPHDTGDKDEPSPSGEGGRGAGGARKGVVSL